MDLYESHKGSLRGFVYVSTWFFLTEELYIQSATIFHFAPLTSNYALYSNWWIENYMRHHEIVNSFLCDGLFWFPELGVNLTKGDIETVS